MRASTSAVASAGTCAHVHLCAQDAACARTDGQKQSRPTHSAARLFSHSATRIFSYSAAHSPTHSLARPPARPPTHPPASQPTHLPARPTDRPTDRPPDHPLTRPLACPLVCSPACSFIRKHMCMPVYTRAHVLTLQESTKGRDQNSSSISNEMISSAEVACASAS